MGHHVAKEPNQLSNLVIQSNRRKLRAFITWKEKMKKFSTDSILNECIICPRVYFRVF